MDAELMLLGTENAEEEEESAGSDSDAAFATAIPVAHHKLTGNAHVDGIIRDGEVQLAYKERRIRVSDANSQLHDLEPTNLHSYCFVSDKVANVYHWLEWVVDRNMPLSEGPPTHAFDVASQAHLPKTLRKYLAATTKAVEKAMAAVIPPDFGAMIDGWTCFGEHYVAVIAIF
ncbi:hypothetical protein PF008_g8118 [Phytophthora fragariae]|uniref:Uncharacterized protein n=1 Tax=Phytophthora fragariae TaxID=53985 RepID=A0A6G0S1I1_9STRA|nr:hypothetical protein PF008_g8118 [Phytophthora fragariae]